MLIYAEKITPRLRYIAETLLGKVVFTDSATEFYQATSPRINYSHKKFSHDEFHIQPYGLLEQLNIKPQTIRVSEWRECKIFFASKGDIPFDIFSAAFYLLSRYEEYLPHRKDSYGRFAHEESLAFREGFLQQPLVNHWTSHLFSELENKFAGYVPSKTSFSFQPTYDIDIAFRYRGRGWLHRLAGLLKGSLLKLNGKDPFDVYHWLDELHRDYRLDAEYFFLMARHKSRYDKNLSPKSKPLRELIRSLSNDRIGLHTSWQSHFDENLAGTERKALTRLCGKEVKDARQHYIMFTLPHTYRSLIQAGIENDFSMGYGSINGFRASYALPFFWYDLVQEEKTSLLLHPFCYMDANSFFEQRLTAEEAGAELQHYHDTVKSANGKLITIFHNHFLTEETTWQPWREMYRAFLQKNFATSPSRQAR